MDQSLQSANELVRQTTLLEIEIVKIACIALGTLAALAFVFAGRIEASGAYRRLMSGDFAWSTRYERQLHVAFNVSLGAALGALLLLLVYKAQGSRIFGEEMLRLINREDGIIETLSAGLLLIAALLAFRVGLSLKRGSASSLMHLFLGVLFVVMLGEEISWGQRYLGLETPSALKGLNVQEEINFHNMFGYFFDHLFILCFFLWGCALPLLYRFSQVCRQICRLVGLPLPSLGLAFAMLAITLMQDQILNALIGNAAGVRSAELRELLSTFAFVLLMLESWRYLIEVQPQARPVSAHGVLATG